MYKKYYDFIDILIYMCFIFSRIIVNIIYFLIRVFNNGIDSVIVFMCFFILIFELDLKVCF